MTPIPTEPAADGHDDDRTAVLEELPPTVEVARPDVAAEPTAGGDTPPRPRGTGRASDTQPLEPVTPAEEPPVTPAAPPVGTATGAGRRRRAEPEPAPPRRRGPLIMLAGAAIGAGVGLAASLGVGPFASMPQAPDFDPNVYRRAPVVIEVEGIGATSSLPPSGSATYEPTLMVDGDIRTAWNSVGDSRPDGVGEQIAVELAQPAWVTSIRVANGNQRDDARFLGNASLSRVLARFDDGSRIVLVFLDQPGEQEVALQEPVLTSRLVLEVLEAHPGDTSEDLAVSELAIIGHVALGADLEWQRELDDARS